MKARQLLLVCMMVIIPTIVMAQNPMFKSTKPQKQMVQKPVSTAGARFLLKSSRIQGKMARRITGLFHQVKTSKKAAMIVILLAFVYGVLHSFGPGHGKVILSTYFLSKQTQLRDVIKAGAIVGFTHGSSAIVIILGLKLLFQLPILKTFHDMNQVIAVVSFSLLIVIGFILFVQAFISAINIKTDDSHDHFEKKGRLGLLSIATGLVPCPGAAGILIFSISTGTLMTGIFAILAMSAGMAMTISLFAFGAHFLNRGVLFSVMHTRFAKRVIIGFRLFGAVLIIGFSLFLLFLVL